MSPHMLEPEFVAPLPPKKDVLLNLRTGKVRPFGGVKLRSAINKHRRQGRVELTELGLVGDEQQYVLHGGVDKALHVFCESNYAKWNDLVPNRNQLFIVGGFGENLSFSGLNEGNVCIGDKFRLGAEVIVQVSEPRQPCYKLNHRFEYKKMSRIVQDTGMAGWYFRVLKPGFIQEGDELVFIERMYPQWSLHRVQDFLYREVDNMEVNAELGHMPELGGEISKLFRNRVEMGVEGMSNRLNGIPGKNRLDLAWRRYRVTEKEMLTSRVVRLSFKIEEAETDVGYEELHLGKFPHVRVKFGPNGQFSRAYSIVAGDMRSFELGVSKDDNSRGGSAYLHDLLKVGDVIQASKGHEASHTDRKKDQAGENIEVHYAVRSRKDMAYSSRLPPEGERTFIYVKTEGNRLSVRSIVSSLQNNDRLETFIYTCGPASLMNECRELTNKLRYPTSQLCFEDFGASTTGTGDPFEAEIKTTGQVLQVLGERSLLDVLNEAGFDIESSCMSREGKDRH
ncbi:hypothetical protein J7T55_000425 [Diaporthe amygdali]|uniref:uncharacterized protein n=1 Tax=Phomopsis amygdali TaxID=1214568 RepID=UPI0022FE6D54|nr:uncharacterized protein J7T55_000425 [Diaporthe amygdali]KAJ0109499.1 hypothetical protein J7T55_000425 [Diaporthe amygdali]